MGISDCPQAIRNNEIMQSDMVKSRWKEKLNADKEFSERQTQGYLALRLIILGFKSLQGSPLAERMHRMWGPRGQS